MSEPAAHVAVGLTGSGAGSAVGPDPVFVVTGFARALRAAGVAADTGRITAAVSALAHLDPADADQLYWAGRVTLCGEPEDLPRYDAVFAEWFLGAQPPAPDRRRDSAPGPAGGPPVAADTRARPLAGELARTPLATAASDQDRLGRRDVADLDTDERAEVDRLVALLAPSVGARRSARRRPGRGHAVDVRRTVRAMLKNGGEPARLAHTARTRKPRRLVLLVDVSGSMSPYADLLLRFGHAAVRVAPTGTEVFTVGSRLTRLTRPLRQRDPAAAMADAGRAIPDWSGGTRLGESLRAFLDLWGQRGAARGAVVVIASDGWERGDPTLLGDQMERLARLAHRVVWVTPHRDRAGFAPVTAGLTAALPHVDDLLAGHTFDALRRLAGVIADA